MLEDAVIVLFVMSSVFSLLWIVDHHKFTIPNDSGVPMVEESDKFPGRFKIVMTFFDKEMDYTIADNMDVDRANQMCMLIDQDIDSGDFDAKKHKKEFHD